MSLRVFAPVLALLAPFLAAPISAAPQGRTDYLNFESTQVKPIAVAHFDERDWVLACNTPDSCVEVYDADTLAYALRIPTGLEPVSVRYHEESGTVYTANSAGDSVTRAELYVDAPGGPLRARLDRTVHVADEPMDVAVLPDGTLAVSLRTSSGFAPLDPVTLAPLAQQPVLFADDPLAPTAALKEPTAMLVSGDKLFALAHRGMGNPGDAGLDVYCRDLSLPNSAAAYFPLSNVATTNFNMEMDPDGSLWLVGSEGETGLVLEPIVAAAPFGFTRSVLTRVTAAGTGSARVEPRDLNLNESASPPRPASRVEAVCQPTDLALYAPGGALQKIYVASFGTDRVVVVSGNLATGRPETWRIDAIDVAPSPLGANPLAGPRGLAVRYGATPADDRVYVLNRLDNSIAVIDPQTDTVSVSQPMRHDPTPQYIRDGRRFLYDGKLSRTHFVSCASCHVDGRIDGLSWNLGSSGPDVDPIDEDMTDGVVGASIQTILASGFFPSNKGPMVTQSLQGLASWEVEPGSQAWFSGAPFHWRGDRPDFEAFQGAFQSLMAGPGVTTTEMEEFRDFVASIHYPPNPEQPLDREYGGSFGTANDEDDGSGAQRGMKLYHTARLAGGSVAGRSCVQCHALPDGSNDRITMVIAGGLGLPGPMLSAHLRGIEQKERFLVRPSDPIDVPLQIRTGIGGMLHGIAGFTINDFIRAAFGNALDGGAPGLPKTTDVNSFVRQLDTGTSPLIGRPWTVDVGNRWFVLTTAWFSFFEEQAGEGNVGVAVQAELGGLQRGFWYDLASRPPVYREVGAAGTWTRNQLLQLLSAPEDRMVVQATGMGDERRVALPGTVPAPLAGPDPSELELLSTAPGTPYVDVPSLTKNWDPLEPDPDDNFEWDATGIDTPRSLLKIRMFQHGLMDDGLLNELRHEPTRRFRVAGDDIRHGARLRITVSPALSADPAVIEMPIYATDEDANGKVVWTTAAEMEAVLLYSLMLGGPEAPNVQDVIDGLYLEEDPPPGTFRPLLWNRHTIEVINADGGSGIETGQQLTL